MGFLRRCLSQQPSVRSALYNGLLQVFDRLPRSRRVIFQLLVPHFERCLSPAGVAAVGVAAAERAAEAAAATANTNATQVSASAVATKCPWTMDKVVRPDGSVREPFAHLLGTLLRCALIERRVSASAGGGGRLEGGGGRLGVP